MSIPRDELIKLLTYEYNCSEWTDRAPTLEQFLVSRGIYEYGVSVDIDEVESIVAESKYPDAAELDDDQKEIVQELALKLVEEIAQVEDYGGGDYNYAFHYPTRSAANDAKKRFKKRKIYAMVFRDSDFRDSD